MDPERVCAKVVRAAPSVRLRPIATTHNMAADSHL